jgi:rsbT co-antagonist protein RsbR
MNKDQSVLGEVLDSNSGPVIAEWLEEVRSALGTSAGNAQLLGTDADRLLRAFRQGLLSDADGTSLEGDAWESLKDVLTDISKSGAARGITASQTSSFVLAFKKPLFTALQARLTSDPAHMASAIWAISTLVDKMSQYTLTVYQRSREEIIHRQQQELLELSTPVVKLWDGVLAVPMIGTLDSSRTQLVMESLLQRIVDTGSELAIIDITGVPTVDTLVAQHLLKTVTAIRLMGADCIISGVRPQIAQTIVHLGIDLQGITTKASLADALALALKRGGYVVTRQKA